MSCFRLTLAGNDTNISLEYPVHIRSSIVVKIAANGAIKIYIYQMHQLLLLIPRFPSDFGGFGGGAGSVRSSAGSISSNVLNELYA